MDGSVGTWVDDFVPVGGDTVFGLIFLVRYTDPALTLFRVPLIVV